MAGFGSDDVLWLAPLAYLLACGWSAVWRRPASDWAVAEGASLTALVVALGGAAAGAAVASAGAPVDGIGAAMTLLIAILGWIVVRYSRRYLAGEPSQSVYVVALLFTLAAALVVVLAQHLGVIVAAWMATSLGLHRLLTFYGERPAALVVAHKKFLASRLAEVCLLAALGLVYLETGTLALSGVASHVAASPTLPWMLHVAAALVALAAILKCAQLPVHGWLIQVMEAPTPVSALLHAGVVNLGGFVLIRLAVLISEAPAAQTLLVLVGGFTAAAAGMVLMTRISIKVRLAWSTCAQMGFMLLECGLGLYDLALLHLVAHSLYKAHAFLVAGDTVRETRRRQLIPRAPVRTSVQLAVRLVAVPVAVGIVAGSVALWQRVVPAAAVPEIAVFLVGLGLAAFLWVPGLAGASTLLRSVGAVVAAAQLYIVWHLGFAALAGPPTPAPFLLSAWAGACLLALYAVQSWVVLFPDGRFSRRLYPWAYGGFFLDEHFTRLTFRVWPLRVPSRSPESRFAI